MKRLILSFSLFVFFGAQAQESTPTFLDGVNAYKNNDFEKARSIFGPLLKEHPENPVLLYNLGLVEYQSGQFGYALGLWRKARFYNSDLMPVEKAIEFTEEQLFPGAQDS